MSTSRFVSVYHNDYADVVTKNFKSFLDNDLYIDLVFVCRNNKKVGAHQVVLGCLSKFFYSVFIENLNTMKEKVLHIYVPDIRAKIMKYILQFIYSGKAMLNKEELAEFHEDIKLLGMPLDLFSPPDEVDNTDGLANGSADNPIHQNRPNVPSVIRETVDLTDSTAVNDPSQNMRINSSLTGNSTVSASSDAPKQDSSSVTKNSTDRCNQISQIQNQEIVTNSDAAIDHSTVQERNDEESTPSNRKRKKSSSRNNNKHISACIDLDKSDDDSDVITIS